jgi:hypothetical protein
MVSCSDARDALAIAGVARGLLMELKVAAIVRLKEAQKLRRNPATNA